MSAETDEQKQERLRKRRREIGADALPRGKMRTCQRERLAAETTADKDPRLQQMSTGQCERLATETTTEKDGIFYSE